MARATIQRITLAQIENVAHQLTCELMEGDEPIPPFVTRFPDRLESCLDTPFQKFASRSLYAGLVGKGAILFYLMIKNHPFQNGNKRVAIMTLLYFMYRNKRWIDTGSDDEMYRFAKEVAKSDPKDREQTMRGIRAFIRKHIRKVAVAPTGK